MFSIRLEAIASRLEAIAVFCLFSVSYMARKARMSQSLPRMLSFAQRQNIQIRRRASCQTENTKIDMCGKLDLVTRFY